MEKSVASGSDAPTPPFQLPRPLTYPGLSIRICEMDLLTAPALSLQSLVPGVRVGVGAWGS